MLPKIEHNKIQRKCKIFSKFYLCKMLILCKLKNILKKSIKIFCVL